MEEFSATSESIWKHIVLIVFTMSHQIDAYVSFEYLFNFTMRGRE
jgi:hypothetical protein